MKFAANLLDHALASLDQQGHQVLMESMAPLDPQVRKAWQEYQVSKAQQDRQERMETMERTARMVNLVHLVHQVRLVHLVHEVLQVHQELRNAASRKSQRLVLGLLFPGRQLRFHATQMKSQ